MMTIKAINARNQFCGHTKGISFGDVISEIVVETPSGVVTAVVSTRSINELRLHFGSKVMSLFKATEVALARL